jgi:voltage-gated potassium channel
MIKPSRFFREFIHLLYGAGHIFAVLFVLFVCFALILASSEASRIGFWNGIYLSAITALTIGYGDLYPCSVPGRLSAIVLGLLGIVLTGVVVAAAIKAMDEAADKPFN